MCYFNVDLESGKNSVEFEEELQESTKAGEAGEKGDEQRGKDSVSARESGAELPGSGERRGVEGM